MRNWYFWAGAIVLGGIVGYAYWYFIGCTSGSCTITSSPLYSSLYGSMMGALLFNMWQPSGKKNDDSIIKND